MKRKSSIRSPCEQEAEKIKLWFVRERGGLLLDQRSGIWRQHSCDLVKLPRTPSQINNLPLYGYEIAGKRRGEKSSTSKKHTIVQQTRSQNEASVFRLEEAGLSQKELASRRVVPCRLKEHALASRKLKSLSKDAQRPSTEGRQIVSLSDTSSKDQPGSTEFWDTPQKSREQPLFDIGRITKFFAD